MINKMSIGRRIRDALTGGAGDSRNEKLANGCDGFIILLGYSKGLQYYCSVTQEMSTLSSTKSLIYEIKRHQSELQQKGNKCRYVDKWKTTYLN